MARQANYRVKTAKESNRKPKNCQEVLASGLRCGNRLRPQDGNIHICRLCRLEQQRKNK